MKFLKNNYIKILINDDPFYSSSSISECLEDLNYEEKNWPEVMKKNT